MTSNVESGVERWGSSDWGIFGSRWYAWARRPPTQRKEGPPRMFKFQARLDERKLRKQLGG